MSGRRASRLAWSLFGVAALIAAAGVTLVALRGGSASIVAGLVTAAGIAAIGALVASSRPGNPIGWIFCASGVMLVLASFGDEYAARAVTDPGSLPAAEWLAWVEDWIWVPALSAMLVFVFLLFPDGRLPSPRWRPVAVLGGATTVVFLLERALRPGPLYNVPAYDNPLGVDALGDAIRFAEYPTLAACGLAVAVSIASLPLRLRHATGQERQQLKWFAYGATVAGVGVVIGGPLWTSVPALRILVLAGLMALPVTVVIGILKHRLYDIDVVISRTLVYGALTAALVASYVGLVLVLQLALSPLTEESDLAIAGSTLAVAALFRPLRKRIQRLVDRRFYRRRYDAARTLEGFATRLRHEVELDAISADLRGVVGETMQPAHVSLWLREASS
ncbi:MAG TPA: hypothetical protein VG126_02090 [Thermoleophilaceae bacterium]|nr:hypothetical protein [Thermoleophilaceae bacterium]